MDAVTANAIPSRPPAGGRADSWTLPALVAGATLVTIGLTPYLVQNKKRMLLGLAVVMAWFNLFTPIAWTYIYYDSLIILAFALVIQSDSLALDDKISAAAE